MTYVSGRSKDLHHFIHGLISSDNAHSNEKDLTWVTETLPAGSAERALYRCVYETGSPVPFPFRQLSSGASGRSFVDSEDC